MAVLGLSFLAAPAAAQNGTVTGTVKNAGTQAPLAGIGIDLYDANGYWVDYDVTDAVGFYSISAPAGTYFVVTYNEFGFIDEAYDNVVCLSCDGTTGTAVVVATNQTRSNIDFALAFGASIGGKITNQQNGLPLAGVEVWIYTTSGQFVTYGNTDALGNYLSLAGLPTGSYYVQTYNVAGFVDEVYNNVACAGCWVTVGNPVAVTAPNLTTINFQLELGGLISGTITNQATGAALSNLYVDIYTVGGNWATWGVTNAQGVYFSEAGLPTGSYLVRTYDTGLLIPEVYDNIACLDCDSTTGTPVAVTAPQTTGNIDFALSTGGRISGTVTNESTGAVVANVWVDLYDSNGRFFKSISTNTSGVYTSPGLPSGTYFAATTYNSIGLIDELFDNIACLSSCSAASGTPITVAAGATSTVNFALPRGGLITGRITNASTGAGIPGVQVWVYNTAGVFAQFGYTDSLGDYATSGLPSGSYYLRTFNDVGFIDEVHSNQVCLSCDVVASGTGVAVTAPNATTVNFALALGGSISGTVRDASGNPLEFIDIDVYGSNGSDLTDGSNGSWLTWATTNALGAYQVAGLATGRYYVGTYNTVGYINEVYNNVPCFGCNPTVGTQVAVSVGQQTSGIDFILTRGGTVTGTVTKSSDNSSLAGIYVCVTTTAVGEAEACGYSNASGVYTVSGVPPGTYFARTFNEQGYIDELYDNFLCLGCSSAHGTPITVTAGTTTSGKNFALVAGGRISGRVTNATAGNAIPNADVYIYTANGSYLTNGYTDDTGRYTTYGGLPAGTYYARAFAAGYVGKLYNNIQCADYCPETSGDAIIVTVGATTSGIDFALAVGGRVSGRVTDAGAPGVGIEGVSVNVYDSVSGSFLGSASTSATGYYTVVGLPSGTFIADTSNNIGFIDEIYDDVHCVTCSVTSGATFSVVTGGQTSGVNFALDRGGRITGTVAAAGGQPIRYVNLSVYDPLNRWVGSAWTDYEGRYSTNGLPPGQYFVQTTYNYEGYINQLYQNLPCVWCTPSSGTPVTVTGTLTTANIDFALVWGGIISGRVATAGGAGLEDVLVSVYDGNNSYVESTYTNVDGTYAITGLASGKYYAKTWNSQGGIDVLYQNVPCLSCGIIGGTSITVAAGSTTPNIDFTLGAGGSITGTVTGSGGALVNISVQVYSGNGQFLETVRTDAFGRYQTTVGLPSGIYFLRTSNTLGFTDELYDNTPCISCNPTTGTPVVVIGTAATPNIDFLLGGAGRITGTIRETGGAPLAGVTVNVYSAAGSLVSSGLTNANGFYTTGAIPGGSYYVRTSSTSAYINQAHRGRECLDCNPTTGTAVAVASGQATNGIDFTLRRGGRVAGVVRATSGAAIPGVSVRIVSAAGLAVASGTSDAAGRYVSHPGLPTGTYYARTSNEAGFVDEIFADVTCASCAATIGAPIDVVVGSDAGGVDFSLAGGGRVAGTIVDSATNLPIAGARVDVYSLTGAFMTSAVTGSAGRYLTGSGLGTGSYFVRASSPLGYVTEVYDNKECAACSPITGTPVLVTTGQTTQSINFALALGGRITGKITLSGSGQALRDIGVTIYNQNNNFVASARTDATGQFTSGFGLPTGTYFARTSNSQGYIDQIFTNTTCLVCTPNTGTAIPVAVGVTTGNVDFQLSLGARFAGSVIETGSNQPVAGVNVSVYDGTGTLVTSGVTDNAGLYQTTGGLPNGTYFARTANEQGYIDKVFDNALCLACDVTRGNSIGVTSPTLVPGVNFSLSPGGRIAGTITATSNGAAIGNVRVAIHNAAGAFVGATYSNAAGKYITTGLPPGSYRLRTFNLLGFIDEAFDNQPCAPCAITAGTSVFVAGAVTVQGTNFVLDAGGIVSGWVTDSVTRAPLAGVTVTFRRSSDNAFVGRSLPSDASGYYAISLPAGTYTAQPDPYKGYSLHLTPGLQPAAIGNVTVEVGLPTPNVEFPLPACTPPSVSPAILPSATAGQSFSVGLSAQGGTGAITFSVASGALPPGLSLTAGGQIVGTPTTLGTANFTVGVTDANGCSTTQTYSQFTCGVSLGESAATFAAAAGTRQVTVAANSSDCGWSSSSSESWVTITSGSGTGAGILAYSVAANPTTAQRTATLTVGSQTYTVTQNGLPVQTQPDPPIGTFDTPATGATVVGSIAVTGWTLSKAGIDRVEIWRDLTTGETTTPFSSPGQPVDGKVFIARGTFVRGARPDVAATYPSYPNADRGGWGYLLLTQGLWNVGNGTFTLYAFAYDVDGRITQLGTKTITANNAQSVKPFGALDTPGYGATVSKGFWNYGWALTPNGNTTDPRSCVITDGNIYVGIDSQPIVPVHYGDTRTDIAGFFPGFSNGSSAGGAYYIDTTALGNGDHQIGWYVIDSCGRADGIGSRIFTVLNGVNITSEAAPRALAADVMAALVVGDTGPIQVRTDEVTRQSLPDGEGVHVITIAQRSRIEVELPKVEGQVYRGGEIVSGAEQTLPLGSSLDAVRGVFYWEPAPAFLGSYELVFAAGDRAPVRVRVVVEPQ